MRFSVYFSVLLMSLLLLTPAPVTAAKKTAARQDEVQLVAQSNAKDAAAKHIVRTVTGETLKTISTKDGVPRGSSDTTVDGAALDEKVDSVVGPIITPILIEVETAPGARKLAEELAEESDKTVGREPASKKTGANIRNLGLEVKPLSSAGSLRFGVQYTADFLSLTLSLAASDVSPDHGAKIYALFWDAASEKPFSDIIWQKPMSSAPPAGLSYVVHAGASGIEASGLVARLKTMKLVLTIAQNNGTERIVHIDLGALCTTNPGNFLNIDSSAQGCP